MNFLKRVFCKYNPFDIDSVISTILNESNALKEQLDNMVMNFERVSSLVEKYEDLLQKADEEVIKINNEKLHIVETVLVHLDKVCDECKEDSVKDITEYLYEIRIQILKNLRKEG